MKRYLIKMKCLNCKAAWNGEATEKDYHQVIYDNDVEHTSDCPGEKVYVRSVELEGAK